jgi:hemerythrin
MATQWMATMMANAESPIDLKPIAWSSRLELGIDAIDAQHQGLVCLHNDLVNGLSHGVSLDMATRIIGELRRYAAYHFAEEERLIERCGYPLAAAHHHQHRGFATSLRNMAANLHDTGFAAQIGFFLGTWIEGHIARSDTDIARYLHDGQHPPA